ncbi:hypothetical protein GF362_00870 [Candidatus Dojkabacteria bacterium]|nr:hypothetical protein [Candidatus Dojkabacteria bacterium]
MSNRQLTKKEEALLFLQRFIQQEKNQAVKSILIIISSILLVILSNIYVIKSENILFFAVGIISLLILFVNLFLRLRDVYTYRSYKNFWLTHRIKNKPRSLVWVYNRKIGLANYWMRTVKNPNFRRAVINFIVLGTIEGRKIAIRVNEDDLPKYMDIFGSLNERSSVGYSDELQRKFENNPAELLQGIKVEGVEDNYKNFFNKIFVNSFYLLIILILTLIFSALVWEIIVEPLRYRINKNKDHFFQDDQDVEIVKINDEKSDAYWKMSVNHAEIKSENAEKEIDVSLHIERNDDDYDEKLETYYISLIEKHSKKYFEATNETLYLSNGNNILTFKVAQEKHLEDFYLRYKSLEHGEVWYFELL